MMVTGPFLHLITSSFSIRDYDRSICTYKYCMIFGDEIIIFSPVPEQKRQNFKQILFYLFQNSILPYAIPNSIPPPGDTINLFVERREAESHNRYNIIHGNDVMVNNEYICCKIGLGLGSTY